MSNPSLCVVVQGPRVPSFENQTVTDYQVLRVADEQTALRQSPATNFLWYSGDVPLHDHALEECIWALRDAEWVTWADTGQAPPPSLRHCAGPLGVRRQTLETPEAKRTGRVRRLTWRCRLDAPARATTSGTGKPPEKSNAQRSSDPGSFDPSSFHPTKGASRRTWADDSRRRGQGTPLLRALQHLENAELLSARSWIDHPVRSASRLIPLRLKEQINRWARRPVFDLSFYLRFKPRNVLIDGSLVEHVRYRPRLDSRRRIALCTPFLGLGGAETVLLELARQIDRERCETFLLATHPGDTRLLDEWRRTIDHIYDLGRMLPTEQTVAAIYSMAMNWGWDELIIQNALPAYSCLPALKHQRPNLRVTDLLHNLDDDWDFFSATLNVADSIDRRVVISEAGRKWLIEMGIEDDKIRLIRNGVDLQQFARGRYARGSLLKKLRLASYTKIILFAGALIPRKRPLLLLAIDRELQDAGVSTPYHFVVAGDGSEERALRTKISSGGVEHRFSVLGHVADIAPLLADADLLVLPSREEGLPLVVNEALAMQVPVVGCRVGAIDEAVPPDCGVLVENDGLEAVELAAALRELLEDDERRAAMGRAGRALAARNYDLTRARRQYRELLDDRRFASEPRA